MKACALFLLIFSVYAAQAQNIIEWSENYELQLSDFQSPATEIGDVNIISLNTGGHIEFSFQMSNAEFMFTKNFNPKVSCTFKRDFAFLVAPDSAKAMELLRFARYEFDLSELYTRKTRQKLYLTKGAFSSASFFKPVFDMTQKEYGERYAQAAKETDLGSNKEKLDELHGEVKSEIQKLADFCKTCKPPKNKK